MSDRTIRGVRDCPDCGGTGEIEVEFRFGVQKQDCDCTLVACFEDGTPVEIERAGAAVTEIAERTSERALTLHQPWASLVALGAKTIETRSWSTKYRGPLAIHAGARRVHHGHSFLLARTARTRGLIDADAEMDFRSLDVPFGSVVATCTLVDVVPTEVLYWTGLWPRWAWQGHGGSPIYPPQPDPCVHELPVVIPEKERPFGDFSPGRFAWLLTDIKKVDPPVPATGKQGLWTWNGGGI